MSKDDHGIYWRSVRQMSRAEWVGSPFFGLGRQPRVHDQRYPVSLAPPSQRTRPSPLSRSFFTSTAARSDPPPTQAPPPSAKPASHNVQSASAAIIKRRPGFFILAPTFIATHFTIAWALVPPIYLLLRQTQLSNTLLAGPQGAWLLSRKVPGWVPDVVVDGIVGPGREADHGQALTVEQLMERLSRRGIRIAWTYAKLGGSTIQTLRGAGKKLKDEQEDKITEEAMRSLGAKDEGKLVEQRAQQGKADQGTNFLRSMSDSVVGYTKSSARTAANDIEFGHVRDAIAAWVLVKVLLPVRLPVSLWLTPKVARTLVRVFSRG